MPSHANVSVAVLRTLHRIHRQLTDLKARLDQGPKRIRAAAAAAARCDKDLHDAHAEVKRLRVHADQKQLQLKAGEDKVKDLTRKLMAAGSNREYQALKDQIAADEMANSVLADEILEGLEQIDHGQTAVKEAERNLAAAKHKAAEVQAEVQKAEPSIRGDLARLEGELTQHEATLPAEIGDFYRRVVRQKGEEALAAIENGVCSGCHQHVPVNICSQVILGTPTFCKTCGRLLYTAEDAAPKPAAEDE